MKSFTYIFRNTEVHVVNAEQILIDKKFIDWKNPFARNRLYNTYRNWQFANWFYQNVILKDEKKEDSYHLELF